MEATESTKVTTTSSPDLQPFIKIPGGKRKLVATLLSYFPKDFFEDPKSNYVEPFLGGGALGLEIINRFSKKGTTTENIKHSVFLNDGNAHVANLWNACIDSPDVVLARFKRHLDLHNEEHYYGVRAGLETLDNDSHHQVFTNQLETAADFLYLDKHCFNGLIRFNRKGHFNTPIGSYTKPQNVDSKNINTLHTALRNLHVHNSDFMTHIELLMRGGDLTKNTVVYFDPPYVPLTSSANFTDYTSIGFTEDDQLRLRGLVDRLTRIGVKVILSNSNTEWVRNEYSDYNIHTVKAGRSINSIGSKRNKIKELIITNFGNNN